MDELAAHYAVLDHIQYSQFALNLGALPILAHQVLSKCCEILQILKSGSPGQKLWSQGSQTRSYFKHCHINSVAKIVSKMFSFLYKPIRASKICMVVKPESYNFIDDGID